MSAREKLFEAMAGGWSLTQAEAAPLYRAIDAFAHELAETVRELSRQGYSAQEAANKIDPKRGAGLMRPDEEPTR